MALMVFIQNIHVFNCRSEKQSALKVPLRKNKLILYGVIFSVLLQVVVMEVPLLSSFLKTSSIPVLNLIILFVMATIVLIVLETYKKIKYNKKKSN